MDFGTEVQRRRPPTTFKLFDEEAPQELDDIEKKTLFNHPTRPGWFSSFFSRLCSIKILILVLFLAILGTLVAGYLAKDGNFLTRFFRRKPTDSEQVLNFPQTEVVVPNHAEDVQVTTPKIPKTTRKSKKEPKRKRRGDYEPDDDDDEEEDDRKPRKTPNKDDLKAKREAERIAQQKERHELEARALEAEKKVEKTKTEEPVAKPVVNTVPDKLATGTAGKDFDHGKFAEVLKELEKKDDTPKVHTPKGVPVEKSGDVVKLKEIEPKNFHLDTLSEKKNLFKFVIDDYLEGKAPKGLPLLYFSSNHDLNLPYKASNSFLKYDEEMYKYIDNDNYILPLVYYGYLSKVIWVKHSNSHALETGKYQINVGNVEGTDLFATDRKDMLEFFTNYSPKLTNIKTVEIEVVQLDDWYKRGPNPQSYVDLISVRGETDVKPPILFVNLDYFDFINPSTKILQELKIDNIEPLVKWKQAANYCFEKQEDSEKIYKFFNAIFRAERTFAKVKIQELARPIIPLWCKGKENAELYFKNLELISHKDSRLLTAITRADLPYHHHNEKETEDMIKRFIGFLDEVYSVKGLVIEPGRPRRPYIAILAQKPYHTKTLLNLIHKLVGELFHSPMGSYEIHDSDELPPSKQKNQKLNAGSAKKQKKKHVKRKSKSRKSRRNRRDDDEDDDEDDEEEEDDRRDRRKRKPKRKPKKPKKVNYGDAAVRKRLDHLLEEVNQKPILDNGKQRQNTNLPPPRQYHQAPPQQGRQ